MDMTCFSSEPKCLAIMVVASLCNDSKASKFLENFHGYIEQKCLYFKQLLKQELQEMLIELKTATKLIIFQKTKLNVVLTYLMNVLSVIHFCSNFKKP